ncbi:MAG: translation initiation factor IF-2 [bacterium]
MRKIRVNELARECEQPNSVILALLPEYGVTEKKTHSSSIDEDVANQIRQRFGVFVEPEAGPAEARPEETPEKAAKEPEVTPVVEAPVVEVEQERPAPAEPAQEPVVFEEPAVKRPAIRPPLLSRGPREAPAPPQQAPLPAVPPPSAPPHAVRPPIAARGPATPPAPPVAPPVAPPRTAPPPAQQPPAAQVLPSTRPSIPARPAPTGPRPGQIISGPRAPLPPPEAPRAPRVPEPPRQRPATVRTPPPPAAKQPIHGPMPPDAVIAGRAPLAGQPAARPVVPPRPDLVARLSQTRAMPGQPTPRPARPATPPVPGQPIYRGPIRPGQPLRPRPGGPGAPGGPAGRGRGMHPTTPLRPEAAVVPTTDTRRGQKDRRAQIDREAEREGKLLRPVRRREEEAKLAQGKQITIAEGITVKELSEKLGIKASLVIRKLVDMKTFATINQTLDVKLAETVAREFGAITSTVSFEQEAAQREELEAIEREDDEWGPVARPPIVTIMGHVDHGKTSLLDAIRQTNVAEGEAGGITQHIGAYQVEKNDRQITFIDTPGHEAFTRMRARGAKVTDIVVLVVAADDGVMPQTLEAIDHSKAAGVPIIVAINKIDRPDAQPERVMQQLSDRGLVPDDWGGDTVMVPVSARTKQNLDRLLDMILLVADMQELKANPARTAVATVLEARLDKGRGPVATVIVRNGTLNVGDFFICGPVYGKVRAMFDSRGNQIKSAGPAQPAEVLGLEALPEVGETLQVVTDTAKAKQIVVYRESKMREQAMAKTARLSLDRLSQQVGEGETKELPLILKADVGGSAEVLAETLQKLSNEKVRIRVIHAGVGAITETDVLLASASNAVIIGFNVRPDRNATVLAEQEKVDIRLHTIIYDLTDEIKRAMAGMLEPVVKEAYKGRAEVRETFHISKVGTIAGCLVVDGAITRDSQVRVLRDNVVVYTGKIASLKRFKNDASEVRSGLECGIGIENFNDIKPNDVIEAFVQERVAAEVPA